MGVEQYIHERVDVIEGHWIWKLAPNNRGYGQARENGERIGAHVLSYKTFKGDIPDGWLVDHAKGCPRNCVNPTHLKAVPRSMNRLLVMRRRTGQMSRRELRVARWLHKQTKIGGRRADLRVPESLW